METTNIDAICIQSKRKILSGISFFDNFLPFEVPRISFEEYKFLKLC